MGSNSQAVIKHINKRKLDLMSVLGGKCCICGNGVMLIIYQEKNQK